jgi:ABC-2 type transport system ATP-binding protein
LTPASPGVIIHHMMNNVVETRGLTVRRGRRTVIDRLDLAVPRGAVVGLLGPSGSGKTTLMRAIVGVQVLAGGTVTVLGRPAGSAPLRGRVGYMTQQASIYEDLSVRANLRYFARVRGAPASEVEHVLERTDLTAQADQLARTLSGGQANRVSLAAAMLGSPDLLVLDEPTVGLDPVLRADLWDIFRGLAEAGTTLLVSSHVMDEATRCDRLLLMREGEVIADITPEELLASTGARSAEEAFLSIIESDVAGAEDGKADDGVRPPEAGRTTSPGEDPPGYRPRHRLDAAPRPRPRGRRDGAAPGEETP